mgnify:CR=1 FL=1
MRGRTKAVRGGQSGHPNSTSLPPIPYSLLPRPNAETIVHVAPSGPAKPLYHITDHLVPNAESSGMRHLKLAFRTLFKTPFVTAVAILPGPGHRRQRGDLLAVRSDAAPAAAGRSSRAAHQSLGSGAQARVPVLQPGRRLRCDLQLSGCSGTWRRVRPCFRVSSPTGGSG